MSNFKLPPTRRKADDGQELVRTDVFYAVSAAQGFLSSENPLIRVLAETGGLDARCSSAPVTLAPL